MDRLDVIEQVTCCVRCKLVDQCTAPVAFTGKPQARIGVVGEAPGGEEDKQGRPFIGPAGQWLRKRMVDVGIDPESLAYMNVVSCFPHGTPTPEHIEKCSPNRLAQLDYLDPEWVLIVGGVALSAWRPDLKVSQTHGRPIVIDGRIGFSCYHPSAAMRRTSYDRELRSDLARFREMMDKGKDAWWKFIPDGCTVIKCDHLAVWWDCNALGWCEKHMPIEGQAHLVNVDNEYRKLSGKALMAPPVLPDTWITDSEGRRWQMKCTCGFHPLKAHDAVPMYDGPAMSGPVSTPIPDAEAEAMDMS